MTGTAPTPGQLARAGWLAMISALLALPLVLLSIGPAGRDELPVRLLEGGIMAVGTAIFVYLILAFRRVLNTHFAFHDADRAIGLLVQANIVLTAVGLLGLGVPAIESATGMFTVIAFLPLGLIQCLFALRLLRLADDLHGLLRPYCWLNLATGISLALIIAAPLALLFGAIADVMLGTIFFQLARQARSAVG